MENPATSSDPTKAPTKGPTHQKMDLAAARTFLLDGAHWRVFELAKWANDPAPAPSLVFESDGAVRRVSNYPADWRDLSDRALLALSWRR
jgi:hypothetical protein